MSAPRSLVVHTTDSPMSWTVEDVRRVHVEERGWRDVGYHDLVRWDGVAPVVEQGRPYDLDDEWEPWEYGAHTRGHNGAAYGLVLVMDEDGAQTFAAQTMLDAAAVILAGLCLRWGLTPNDVRGHREMTGAATECPAGVDLDDLRARVRRALGDAAITLE